MPTLQTVGFGKSRIAAIANALPETRSFCLFFIKPKDNESAKPLSGQIHFFGILQTGFPLATTGVFLIFNQVASWYESSVPAIAFAFPDNLTFLPHVRGSQCHKHAEPLPSQIFCSVFCQTQRKNTAAGFCMSIFQVVAPYRDDIPAITLTLP